jgi:hypothetical protein
LRPEALLAKGNDSPTLRFALATRYPRRATPAAAARHPERRWRRADLGGMEAAGAGADGRGNAAGGQAIAAESRSPSAAAPGRQEIRCSSALGEGGAGYAAARRGAPLGDDSRPRCLHRGARQQAANAAVSDGRDARAVTVVAVLVVRLLRRGQAVGAKPGGPGK